jgi:hypothetical protein
MPNLPTASDAAKALDTHAAARVLGTILKHDSKQTSYKIALLRAINDLAVGYPDLKRAKKPIAIPLQMLARYWVAYYWPFYAGDRPILQGYRYQRAAGLTNDMAFRKKLTDFRQLCIEVGAVPGEAAPGDGFWLIDELNIRRKRKTYPDALWSTYQRLLSQIARIINENPVRHAGPGEWNVFSKPRPFHELEPEVVGIPGTADRDACLVVSHQLWEGFQLLSPYVESLCIHEWSIFTERVNSEPGQRIDRGEVFLLLTSQPEYRRPLSWERGKVDDLLAGGVEFICPWSQKTIQAGSTYQLDHVIPISLYPINELWNLMPVSRRANLEKRAQIPSEQLLEKAAPSFARTYQHYLSKPDTRAALREDTARRFTFEDTAAAAPAAIANAVISFVDQFGGYRNIGRFDR